MRDTRDERELSFLIDRYGRGDDSALGRLVEHESEALAQWIERRMPRRLRRRHGVSDIIQQTAIELMALRPRFENRGASAFRKLLRLIAGRVLAAIIDRDRTQRRDSRRTVVCRPPGPGTIVSADGRGGGEETPSQQLVRAERIAGVKRCFSLLAPPDREIIRLVDYDGLCYADAARSLGLAEPAARKRHSRAVARLRRLMEGAGLLDE